MKTYPAKSQRGGGASNAVQVVKVGVVGGGMVNPATALALGLGGTSRGRLLLIDHHTTAIADREVGGFRGRRCLAGGGSHQRA